jgi:hypothetical protein
VVGECEECETGAWACRMDSVDSVTPVSETC